jgi:hypothetical protein
MQEYAMNWKNKQPGRKQKRHCGIAPTHLRICVSATPASPGARVPLAATMNSDDDSSSSAFTESMRKLAHRKTRRVRKKVEMLRSHSSELAASKARVRRKARMVTTPAREMKQDERLYAKNWIVNQRETYIYETTRA